MEYLPLAFIMGLIGSMHCAVMCGPIMLSLPTANKSFWHNGLQLFLYQFGRIFTYSVLGLVVGLIGNSFQLLSNQKVLSLIIGAILILFATLQLNGKYSNKLNSFQFVFLDPISKLMGKLLGKPYWGFFAGLLNGLIPCGMVYLALATALNLADMQKGAEFMLLFGLGTAPLMLMISLGGIYLKKYFRFNTNKLIPWFMLFLGLIFILRSAALGITFLSPNLGTGYHTGAIECR